ncbi:uncharacterized protein LOC133362527, partial [Lethenteron reissneri]|uniref:uncharacterized protein LOC133362527 n=1 Tax=Lethenteron reissneri TaxID=7753 RepID=UPI002AB76327
MSLTRQEAYTALGLPYGAPEAEIKSAYKKLALEWHSDKNNHSSDTAAIRFQQATGAYQLLAAEKTEAHMSLEDILDLLNVMFFGAMGGFPFHRQRFVFSNGDRDKFCISDDGNVDDLLNPSGGSHEPSAYPCQSSREPCHGTQASSSSSNTSTAHTEANHNAADLFQEEENAKTKTETKQKRRRERKRQERGRKERHEKPEDDDGEAPASAVPQEPRLDTLTRRSIKIAIQGNRLVRTQSYAEAIDKFTDAISLCPRDHRFYGNRSFCLEHLGLYTDALFDAEIAIYLNPTWPRGYFRQARACIGLK